MGFRAVGAGRQVVEQRLPRSFGLSARQRGAGIEKILVRPAINADFHGAAGCQQKEKQNAGTSHPCQPSPESDHARLPYLAMLIIIAITLRQTFVLENKKLPNYTLTATHIPAQETRKRTTMSPSPQ